MANVVNFKEEFIFEEPMIRAKDIVEKIFIGLDLSTITKWTKEGLLTQYKIGGSKFYKLSEIKFLIENSKVIDNIKIS